MSKYLELRLDNKEFFRSDQSHSLHGLLAVVGQRQQDEHCEQILSKSSDTNQFHGHFLPPRKITVVREPRSDPGIIVRDKGQNLAPFNILSFFVFQHGIQKKFFASIA